eukprot:TRINITY_DN31872_c0_g1_i1.p1 TRINITY_DN31872_c0_g1~~TRINITY_DN31872_c0_g1_i1.p1  ORF type:complete len:347 (+),score=34.21 TRINITY_DN31872_c0_g1_i1:61-1101(+)
MLLHTLCGVLLWAYCASVRQLISKQNNGSSMAKLALSKQRALPQELSNDAVISLDWDTWLAHHGRSLGNRLGWFPGPDYEVEFADLVSPDEGKPCSVTFIVDKIGTDMILNLFSTEVLKKLVSDKPLPRSGERVGEKVWKQILFESKCLSIGLKQNGIGHLNGISTEWPEEYGGCGCLNRGKFLLQLADLVSCKFGMTSIEGTDSSAITCKSNPEVRAPMGLFYAIKTGKSWYESFGYEYFQGAAANASIRLVADGSSPLNEAVLRKSHSHLLYLYKDHLGEEYQHATNRAFSLWVWEHHCEEWTSVVDALFRANTVKSVFQKDMKKSLDCDAVRASSEVLYEQEV